MKIMAMLEVKDLKVYYRILKGTVRAVDGVSFSLDRGQTMGLVGESGCGKTTAAFAITRLLPSNGYVVGGEVVFDGVVVGRADLPTEMNEALKKEKWLNEVDNILKKREDRLMQIVGRNPSELILESDRYLEEEREILAELKEAFDKRMELGEEEAKKELQRIVDRELKGFGALGRRRRREKDIEERISSIRWSKVSMIFQSAMNAFNPVYRVGDQIAEALMTHEKMTKEEAMERTAQLFDLVGLDRSRITGYPHEFSGGMRQRSMIAMALACNPQLLIADEPTTALDVIMQDRILAEIRDLQRKLNIAMIIITHDISVVAEVAEMIGIMYAGQLLEYGDIEAIFSRPSNPYSIGLMGAFPSIKGPKKRLKSIPGSPPDLSDPPPGCRFHPRCPFAQEICKREEPLNIEVEKNHFSACHFAREIFTGKLKEA